MNLETWVGTAFIVCGAAVANGFVSDAVSFHKFKNTKINKQLNGNLQWHLSHSGFS